MVAPWTETSTRVVVEFKKSNEGVHRRIEMTHRPDILPPQLYGRVAPEVWGSFMTELSQLTSEHPYVAKATGSTWAGWCGAAACFMALGFAFCDPDPGDYGIWLSRVEDVINRHAPSFAHGGATLSMQRVHGNFFVALDVNPMAVAVGAPAAAPYYPPPQQAPYYPQQQAAPYYPPQQAAPPMPKLP